MLLRIDPEIASGWSDVEVVERSKEIMDVCVANLSWVAETRKHLSSLGWFRLKINVAEGSCEKEREAALRYVSI